MTKRSFDVVKAVIFDFDGTLADSFPVFIRAAAHVLNRRPFSAEEIDDLRQYSAREIMMMLRIKKWKLPLLVAKGLREVDRHQDDIVIFPTMAKALRALHLQGYKLYIVSSHSERGIQLFLERYGLTDTFEHIYCKIGLFGKHMALKKLQTQFNYRSSECVLVGDEVRDIEAAKKAHMWCIAVSWGFNTPRALAARSPRTIVDKPLDLIEALSLL